MRDALDPSIGVNAQAMCTQQCPECEPAPGDVGAQRPLEGRTASRKARHELLHGGASVGELRGGALALISERKQAILGGLPMSSSMLGQVCIYDLFAFQRSSTSNEIKPVTSWTTNPGSGRAMPSGRR